MFKIMVGEYEDAHSLEMSQADRIELNRKLGIVMLENIGDDVVFVHRKEAEGFVTIFNLDARMRCDHAWIDEI